MSKNDPTREHRAREDKTAARPRSGRRILRNSHATLVVSRRHRVPMEGPESERDSNATSDAKAMVRVVLTKPAHYEVRRSRSLPGKMPCTGEWEVSKSS